MARAVKAYRVTISNTGETIACLASQTVLQAALAAGIDYPYACATGNCATCISQLDTGKIDLLPRSDASLGAEQVKSGKTLACRARPRSDIGITWLGRGRK
ncbi:MAG: 2Fe-2S iron-sulfur cluster-binding protein [Alphaproteobacteria bacterium]|nr:2Fe-2S iron-sulfur cluster-binding protein [Alphaproteobacteria bacterium]